MIQLLAGDCRDVLATLPAESVQCCVSSPPYYGLRDYGTALWDGGDAACGHVSGMARQDTERETPGGRGGSFRGGEMQYRDTCGKCGARRIDRQIGLEASPDEYLATMVAVFREVRRVLRKDGTCWVNLGDLFVNKQLQMMPARTALALQADGWILRSSIIWHKPNPMPESCTDRPTSSYEHVYLLTRSARYYYDAEAVREEADPRASRSSAPGAKDYHDGKTDAFNQYRPSNHNLRNVWTIATHSYPNAHFATYPPQLAERCIRAGTSERGACSQCGKPWVRETSTEFVKLADRRPTRKAVQDGANMTDINSHNVMGYNDVTTTGWAPACACNADVRPCVVLDPFAGAGTTLLVADRLQRDAIGIELNPSYTEMAMQRCRDDAPLFTAFPPADDPEDARMADLFAELEYGT